MKKNIIFFFFLLFLFTNSSPTKIHAEEKSSGTSAAFLQPSEITKTEAQDNRAQILRKFFQLNNSPLADSAETFVREADTNNIDWKLLPAISGVESTFGLAEPAYCNNAWGYNIYGDVTRCFESYDHAISIISKDVRTLYMNQWGATDVYSLGRIYAASPTWAYRVNNYMDQIESFALATQNPPLPISL